MLSKDKFKALGLAFAFFALIVLALMAIAFAFFLSQRNSAANSTASSASTSAETASSTLSKFSYQNETLSIGSTTIAVQISDTEALREQGLSDRDSLASSSGMWFVFPSDVRPYFWMKDMHFPLDIIWFDSSMRIVDITSDLLPSSYPGTVAPHVPVLYVLEVNAGFAQQNGLKVGDVAVLH